MKTLKRLCLFGMLFNICIASGQQVPNFTQYNFNKNIINPAFVGVEGIKEVNISYRTQWVGVSYSPNTQVVSFNMPITDKIGFGLSFINDRVFTVNERDATVDFSYKFQLSPNYELYAGVKLGGGFVEYNPKYNVGLPRGAVRFDKSDSFFNPHVGIGVLLKHEKYYITASLPNILNGDRYEKKGNIHVKTLRDKHFYVGGGFTAELDENYTLSPALMVRYLNENYISYDFSSTLEIHNRLQLGLNYRLDEMVSLFSITNLTRRFKVGFVYDFTLSKIRQVDSNGYIEFILKYQI